MIFNCETENLKKKNKLKKIMARLPPTKLLLDKPSQPQAHSDFKRDNFTTDIIPNGWKVTTLRKQGRIFIIRSLLRLFEYLGYNANHTIPLFI